MNYKFLKAAIVGLVLSVSSFASAGLITVDWEFNGGSFDGTFSGADNNSDGILTFDELSDFSPRTSFTNVNLSNLVDVGDFNLSTGQWLSNAISWTNQPDNAWFTWNNRGNSVNSLWASVTVNSVTGTSQPVPEPSTLAIFALGMIGLASRRFKKQS
ncbi:MAG: hypothetical protein ACI9N3_001876 [Colwellia sp.]|jgi:hypothetical protein